MPLGCLKITDNSRLCSLISTNIYGLAVVHPEINYQLNYLVFIICKPKTINNITNHDRIFDTPVLSLIITEAQYNGYQSKCSLELSVFLYVSAPTLQIQQASFLVSH